MTVVSTTLAIGFLPLNMFIYTRYWTDEDSMSDLPYVNMVFSMLYTWVAVAIGVVIAWKAPKHAKYVAKVRLANLCDK
jgi:sodium/bile acid cotransporter 2